MDFMGNPFVFDLAAAPHLLVAGTTGSGKSVFLNDIILSILFTKTSNEVRFVMVDPKRVELGNFNGIPHMAHGVVFTNQEALNAMRVIDQEMMNRYRLFAEVGVKKIDNYNKVAQRKMPRIVIIIDEYMEMMFEAPKEVEDIVSRIARMARAAGIHLVMATQRPSSEVVTGSIKSNIPCRASFTVLDGRESKIIMDQIGAERLMGNGDMLFSATDVATPIHAQASYVSSEEVDRTIEYLKTMVCI